MDENWLLKAKKWYIRPESTVWNLCLKNLFPDSIKKSEKRQKPFLLLTINTYGSLNRAFHISQKHCVNYIMDPVPSVIKSPLRFIFHETDAIGPVVLAALWSLSDETLTLYWYLQSNSLNAPTIQNSTLWHQLLQKSFRKRPSNKIFL